MTECQYVFDIVEDRFDTQVMRMFNGKNVSRLTRDAAIAKLRHGEFDKYLLKSVAGLEDLPNDTCYQAAISVIDFHFEAIILANLDMDHLASYCAAIEKVLPIEAVRGIETGKPLWIDTVHHACVFSTIAQAIINIGKNLNYTKAILIHQGERQEPRLGLISNLIKVTQNIEPHLIKLSAGWFSDLVKRITHDTIVIYLADMPPQISRSISKRPERSASLSLLASVPQPVIVETISGSHTFARRVGACHMVMDYPRSGRVRLRPYDAANPVMQCPIEDWVFWPLINEKSRLARATSETMARAN
jgi:hypothetical protein